MAESDTVMRYGAFALLQFLLLLAPPGSSAQNVIIVLIDGARHSESFGAREKYMPRIWNDLRPAGTIFTNFRNDGFTLTNPSHAAVMTGVWQKIDNNGKERPASPTLFEYFRKQTGLDESSCAVVTGKPKIQVVTHSDSSGFGEAYGARYVDCGDGSDISVWKALKNDMTENRPRLVLVNLPDVDIHAHDGDWRGYIRAIRRADSLIALLWSTIESDEHYRGKTTLIVTNDHGRHSPETKGFMNHGDECEGCRHIMCIGLGPGFAPGAVVDDTTSQTDIPRAAARILGVTDFPAGTKSMLTAPVPDTGDGRDSSR